MRYSVLCVFAVTLSEACVHTLGGDSTCENRETKLVGAMEVAAHAVYANYGHHVPTNFDAGAYLATARAYPLSAKQLEVLESVELEVWTKDSCDGAMVVARCPGTKRAIVADDTAATSVIEYRGLLTRPQAVPRRPSTAPSCVIRAATPPPGE